VWAVSDLDWISESTIFNFGYGLDMDFMKKFRIGSGLQNFHICTPLPHLGADSSAVGLYWVTVTCLSSDSRCFATCCCLLLKWTQTSDNAARQWPVIVVSHVVLYCMKRSQSECIHPQVWNIYLLVQWFPTGVPRHPRVPFTIPRGAAS